MCRKMNLEFPPPGEGPPSSQRCRALRLMSETSPLDHILRTRSACPQQAAGAALDEQSWQMPTCDETQTVRRCLSASSSGMPTVSTTCLSASCSRNFVVPSLAFTCRPQPGICHLTPGTFLPVLGCTEKPTGMPLRFTAVDSVHVEECEAGVPPSQFCKVSVHPVKTHAAEKGLSSPTAESPHHTFSWPVML